MQIPEALTRYLTAGATLGQLNETETEMNIKLPAEFRDFLMISNGLSVDGGLLIYGTEDLAERNQTWEVAEYAPGYLAIGDSGGGDVFLMKSGVECSAIYVVESGIMTPEFMEPVAASVREWLVMQ